MNMFIDRNAHTITFRRRISAPREQVFEAWTRAEHVTHWWDAAGAKLAECEIDLRPGGAFKFVNVGASHAFSGQYRVITPPEQLVFEAMGSIGKVVLADSDGGTAMTVTIECSSAAHLDEFLKMGVDVGTARTLDNLVAYAGNRQ
jgi:uncharacterized protein YndB with AHSA1/START domain